MDSKKNDIGAKELEKRIMDLLVMLYSDQTGVEYTYRFIDENNNENKKLGKKQFILRGRCYDNSKSMDLYR